MLKQAAGMPHTIAADQRLAAIVPICCRTSSAGRAPSAHGAALLSPRYAQRPSQVRGSLIFKASAAESTAAAAAVCNISVAYKVNYGECLKVVGSGPVLGDWDGMKGIQLAWTEGDVWRAQVPLESGHYEFKCVVFNDNTKTVERWEESPANRKLVVPSAKGATVFVDCVWADVEAMSPQIQIPPPFKGAIPAAAGKAQEAKQAAPSDDMRQGSATAAAGMCKQTTTSVPVQPTSSALAQASEAAAAIAQTAGASSTPSSSSNSDASSRVQSWDSEGSNGASQSMASILAFAGAAVAVVIAVELKPELLPMFTRGLQFGEKFGTPAVASQSMKAAPPLIDPTPTSTAARS